MPGHVSLKLCEDKTHYQSRVCLSDGTWGNMDATQCIKLSAGPIPKKLPEAARIPTLIVVLIIGIVLAVYNSYDHTKPKVVEEQKHEKIVHCPVRDSNENKEGDIVIDPTVIELEIRRSRIESREGALPLIDSEIATNEPVVPEPVAEVCTPKNN